MSAAVAGDAKARTYDEIHVAAQSFFKKYDVDIVGKMATLW
jgi:hypothetical protein